MSETAEPSNLLEFRQRSENIPWDPKTENMTEKKRLTWSPTEHKHRPFIVDEKERTVECKRCGKVLDPIYVICLITEMWDEMDWKIKAYKEVEARAAERQKKEQGRRRRRSDAGASQCDALSGNPGVTP